MAQILQVSDLRSQTRVRWHMTTTLASTITKSEAQYSVNIRPVYLQVYAQFFVRGYAMGAFSSRQRSLT